MNREKIERLAIDSVSGQLNEDAEALLLEYLVEHPEANKWFLDMQNIYNETQAVFDSKTESIKEQAENKLTPKFNWFPAIRWAAVIIIAAYVGMIAGRRTKPTVAQQKQQQVIVSSDKNTKSQGIRLENISEGFWRDKIIATLNPTPAKIHRNRSSRPSLWEQYRQYKGEKL